MEKNGSGKIYLSEVILRPKVIFSDDKQASIEEIETMHHQSHEQCYITTSVKTEVVTEIIA